MKKNKEVIKHSAAIQISNEINLLQRRTWNVLLANAYDDLANTDIYKIKLKDLADVLGFNSKNDEYLKNVFRKLNSTQVEWNTLNKDKEHEWGVTTLLAEASLINGVCHYAYAPSLRKKLHNPSMYARINLSLQNQFKSKHSLALYEICVDYYFDKQNTGQTPVITLTQFRKILGFKQTEYEHFKDLKKHVIKKAISEINKKTDLFVEDVYTKQGRSVSGIKFKIKKNPKKPLLQQPKIKQQQFAFDEFNISNPELLNILVNEFGITKTKAIEILKTTDEFYIKEVLETVKQLHSQGKINNLPAFTISAIKQDYRPIITKSQKISQEKAKNKNELNKAKKLGETLYQQFIDEVKTPEITKFEKSMSPKITNEFNSYINSNPLFKKLKDRVYIKRTALEQFIKTNKLLNLGDERFINFAFKKGYKVKKEDKFGQWVATAL